MISKIWIKNFRNINEITLDLEDKNHCYIFGDNNHGKTTLLMAIYIASKQQAVNDIPIVENIQYEKDNAYIGLQVEAEQKERIYIKIDNKGKIFSTVNNKKETKKQANLRNIDYICADALHIFQKEPGFRRKILDVFCCCFDTTYEDYLRKYEKILRQKNKYLKQENPNDSFLLTLNEQIVSLAIKIVNVRKKALKEIEAELNNKTQFKQRLNIKNISLSYSHKRVDIQTDEEYEQKLKEVLVQDKEKEKILGYSLSGPQRDDFDMLLENKSIFISFSRGINRSYAILFRLAQIECLKQERTYQALLLDDTFAEIDQKNREILFKEITKKYQVFYATTTQNDARFFEKTKQIEIKDGDLNNV
tara:strand:+ start:470 stop:1555 length:1086 start_codon:yes stop_codon:yes gene_type:complete